MTDLAVEFQRLLERRDLAAYRAVAMLDLVIHFFEAQDYDTALSQLKRAQSEFQEAARSVQQFQLGLTKGETNRHGNSISAA